MNYGRNKLVQARIKAWKVHIPMLPPVLLPSFAFTSLIGIAITFRFRKASLTSGVTREAVRPRGTLHCTASYVTPISPTPTQGRNNATLLTNIHLTKVSLIPVAVLR